MRRRRLMVSARTGAVALLSVILAGQSAPQAAGSVVRQPYSARADPGAQVTMVADLNPGAASALYWSGWMWRSGGSVIFTARTVESGREPWVSAGTASTTRLVGDIVPGPGDSYLRHVASTEKGTLLATASEVAFPHGAGSYWLTTATGVDSGELTLLWSSPLVSLDAVRFGGDALVSASDFGFETALWRTDGTPGNPQLVTDEVEAEHLVTTGDRVFFLQYQNQLMVTDGTTAGTQHVRSWANGEVLRMRRLDGQSVVFKVTDGGPMGGELWVSDGTREGTILLRDIRRGPGDSNPLYLRRLEGWLYFLATDGIHGRQVWRTDGTPAGTTRVTNLAVSVRQLAACRGSLVFFGLSENAAALWTTSGVRGSARRLVEVPGATGRRPRNLRCMEDGIVFTADDGRHGREVWSLRHGDDKPVLHDIRPGPKSSQVRRLTRAGSVLYFMANDGTHGRELWTARF